MAAGTGRYLLRNVQTRRQMAASAVLAFLLDGLSAAGNTAEVARTARRIGATSVALVSVRWAPAGLGPEKRPFSLPAFSPRAFQQLRRVDAYSYPQALGR